MDPQAMIEWVWVFLLAGTLMKAAGYRMRAASRIRDNPQLAAGYTRITWGFAIGGTIPWVIMGMGQVTGGVPSFYDFWRRPAGNPFVIAFYLCGCLILGLWAYWILFRNGAEVLARHPGLLASDFETPRKIRLVFGISLVVAVVSLVVAFTEVMPLPQQITEREGQRTSLGRNGARP